MKKAGLLSSMTSALLLALCLSLLTACTPGDTPEETAGTAVTEADTVPEAPTEPETVGETVPEVDTEADTEPEAPRYSFDALTPADGAEVVLTHPSLHEWYSQYTSADAYFSSAAVTQAVPNNLPVPVTLSWQFSGQAEAYTLTYGLMPDLSDGTALTLTAKQTKLRDLFVSTTYYWCVSTTVDGETVTSAIQSFTTADTPRLTEVKGLENARDLGGVATSFGVPIRQGLAYRTGRIDQLAPSAVKSFNERYGIRTELDLRYTEEIEGRTVSPLGADVRYVSIPSGQYAQVFTNAYPDAFKNALLVFADEANYPIVFHCSAGRDRTGCLAAVLCALCGADEVAIMRDYEITYLKNASNPSLANETCTKMMSQSFIPFLAQMKLSYGSDDLRVAAERLCLDVGLTETDILAIRTNLLGNAFEDTPVAAPLPEPTAWEEQAAPVMAWAGDAIAQDLIGRSMREHIETVTENGDYVTVTASSVEGVVYCFRGTASVPTAPVLAVKYRTDSLPSGAYFEVFCNSVAVEPGAGDSTRAPFVTDGEWHVLYIDMATAIAPFNGTSAHVLRFDLYNRAEAGQTVDYAFIGTFTSLAAAQAHFAGDGA